MKRKRIALKHLSNSNIVDRIIRLEKVGKLIGYDWNDEPIFDELSPEGEEWLEKLKRELERRRKKNIYIV